MSSDFRVIILGIVTVINLVFAPLILLKGKKREESRTFGLFMFYRDPDPSTPLFWAKSLYFAGNFIATAFLYFSFIFPERQKVLNWWQKVKNA